MSLTLSYNGSTVVLPSPLFGDSEEFGSNHIVDKDATDDFIRYVDLNWNVTHEHTFDVGVYKCSATYSSFEDVESFLLTSNGKPVTLVVYSRTFVGFLTLGDVSETKNTWNLSLKFRRVLNGAS